jgi:hypothetical protein
VAQTRGRRTSVAAHRRGVRCRFLASSSPAFLRDRARAGRVRSPGTVLTNSLPQRHGDGESDGRRRGTEFLRAVPYGFLKTQGLASEPARGADAEPSPRAGGTLARRPIRFPPFLSSCLPQRQDARRTSGGRQGTCTPSSRAGRFERPSTPSASPSRRRVSISRKARPAQATPRGSRTLSRNRGERAWTRSRRSGGRQGTCTPSSRAGRLERPSTPSASPSRRRFAISRKARPAQATP